MQRGFQVGAWLTVVAVVLGSATTGQGGEKVVETAAQARAVLRANCSRCHNGPGSEGGDFDLLKTDDVINAGFVKPKDADGSRLLQRILRGEMPPKPARLFAEDVAALQTWIKAGAPEFAKPQAPRNFITLKAVLTAIRDHLQQADKHDVPYLRFFTLHNLANDPRIPDDELRLYRAALSKVANSLSYKSRIVIPKALDKDQLLFVIDLRDYDWDRNDGWQALIRAYPYGLKYGSLRDQTLRKLDDDISHLSGCVNPLIRGDWFITNASRPPLYYQLLNIPKTAAELEKDLKVDIAANFLNPVSTRIARAGFAKSGVSGQNRLVERHDAAHGYYWKSYDFKPDSARTKLTRFPLGPLNLFPHGQHPYADQAFVHDGGEIIFSLPNGLQAYMLINGKDERIDEGPIQVVGDALKTSGTHAIVNGVSCMSCHKQGMIGFTDSIRTGHSLYGEKERLVERLYPDKETMDKLLEQDEQRFMPALEKAVGPFLRHGDEKNKELKDFTEPVGLLSRLYQLGYVDLQTVASELDEPDPAKIVQRVGARRMKELGLESLLKPGRAITRLEWEASAGISLMQELARELDYTPIR